MKSVKLRPSYFEAVEHLVGLLCAEHRAPEAVHIIDFVERSLRRPESGRQSTLGSRAMPYQRQKSCTVEELSTNPSHLSLGLQCNAEEPAAFDFKRRLQDLSFSDSNPPAKTALGLSGYAIPESENGRLLALIHAKGNLLYAMGDVAAAKEAFEAAVLIAVGTGVHGIHELIQEIQRVLSGHADVRSSGRLESVPVPLLLHPKKALLTANLLFPQHGQLPGLQCVPEGNPKIAAISTTSNSLLSLAKIFQDGLCSQVWRKLRSTSSVGDILALYYLSLSLQPSPSTANNVGILLAGVQHAVCTPATPMLEEDSLPVIPGVVPGSGIALALAYYNYGLNLDQKHAHLYTNLGSLLKDIGQLTAAIKMYEKAVACDKDFDIGEHIRESLCFPLSRLTVMKRLPTWQMP
jgi:tetratricopeptide (TPR) repeat protein